MIKKRILVTGASRGIGAEIAKALANKDNTIVVHYHQNQTAATSVANAIVENGGDACILQFDIANRENTQCTLEADIEAYGAYYGVVCNAGIAADAAFPALNASQWDSVIHTNLDGFYNVLHTITMPMIRLRSGGRIVTLSSVSGLVGNRGQVNYSAAKAGIIGATKALAIELAKRKITVNCVAPGIIETDMTKAIADDIVKKSIPLERIGKPVEVAATVKFLMSDDASYITRQVISVNGGMC